LEYLLDSFGIIGLLPFLIALFFLVWQEDVIIPMIGGLILGAIILSKFNPLLGLFQTAGELVLGALFNSLNILVLALIVLGLILFTLLNRCGYVHAFMEQIERKIRNRELLEIIIFLSSLLIFIDRHLSSLLTGIFTKPLARRKKLTAFKHAYILNTVSSSIFTLIPLTTLTPFSLAAIGMAFKSLGIEFSPLRALYMSLPYQFFNIFAFFTSVTLLVINKDLLFMKRYSSIQDEKGTALSFGLSTDLESRPHVGISFYGFIGSLTVVFGTVAAGVLLSRRGSFGPLSQQYGSYGIVFVNALFLGILFTFLYSLISRTVHYRDWKTRNGSTLNPLAVTLIFIVLAFSVELLARKLSLGSILVGKWSNRNIPVTAIPLLLFILSSVVSFLSGSATFTVTSIIPLALRIMSSNMTDPLLVDHFIFASIGAVLSGASFGDMNSPFSLNFIIATAATNAPIMRRFTTQIGYSLFAYAGTVIFGYLLFMLGVKPYVSISAGFLVLALALMFFTNSFAKPFDIFKRP
jgi:Na+/H+ antiporter NhaC